MASQLHDSLRVGIVGAGPSGLVAAKTLLNEYPGVFKVTIFEKSHRVGGLWPISKDDNGMVNPDMCTNQSHQTVSFSDCDWKVDTPQFPKAWQVGQYLDHYRKQWISSKDCTIHTNVKVLNVLEPGEKSRKWQVSVQDKEIGHEVTHEFDHVIIASGFFGGPKIPQVLQDLPVPVIHSSQFRDIKPLLKGRDQGTKIVVVGGQMSGVEVAASIAFQLSSAANSPGEKPIPDASKYTVHHVVQQPFWVMPLFFPVKPKMDKPEETVSNPASAFLPLDLVMYNLDWRPPGALQNTSGHITSEAANTTNDFMNTYIGTDQSQLGEDNLAMKGDVRSKPPWLAISDNYTEFVRSKKIITHKGKLTKSAPGIPNAIIIDNEGNESKVDDVAAVIFATGFEAAPSVNFLSPEVLKTLGYDSTSSEFPLALDLHSTIHRSIPSLGFVGFYRSPYWGVMEMQSRFLGRLWTGDEKARQALEEDDTLSKVLELRKSDRLAQFPMGDYAYLMESFKEVLKMNRWEVRNSATKWIVLPQRYRLPESQANPTLEKLYDTITNAQGEAKFVSRAIFRALQGDWKVVRSHESSISTYPSGEFRGTSRFLPRLPTDPRYDMEYLYVEEGNFKANNGLEMSARRRYAYRYIETRDSELQDTLSVWFIKPDDLTIDYHFHDLQILPPTQSGQGWRAKARHWCTPDTYDVEYEFRFSGTVLERWTMNYKVKGPAKDYELKNVFTR